MISLPRLSPRLMFFSTVGGFAASIHLLIVFNLVQHFAAEPLVANIIAFFIAFNISYLGHKYLTFSQLEQQKKLSLPHFFIVASSAGVLNESLYFLLLNYTPTHYIAALILVLGIVALYSFVLARYWACR